MADEAELFVEGQPMEPPPGWSLDWVDREQRVAVLHGGGEEGGEGGEEGGEGGEGGGRRALVAVDGGPGEWVVTLRGRPIRVTVRSHRDRLLAEAATSAGHRSGAAEVRASLPGLVVRVAVSVGDAVGAGDPLVTIEAMKMQNEIRAPRAGRVAEVTVTPGQAIAGGALLVRLAEPDP